MKPGWTKKASLLLVASVVALLPAVPASATVELGFIGITSNSPANVAAMQGQLSVTIDQVLGADQAIDPSKVSFTFWNAEGGYLSSITDIYFDDGTLLGISDVINGPNVAFTGGSASPGNLPGGQGIGFQATQGFLADSDPPTQPNGVNPGEWVKIVFDLQENMNYQSVLAALADSSLRIGVHVQGFPDGGSESFVNGPATQPVPEPGTMMLLGSGMVGLAGIARKKFRR